MEVKLGSDSISTEITGNRTRPRRRTTLRATQWLAVIVVLGALLRFFPIWFGLPLDRARPDEEAAVGHALAMLQGDLHPHFFDWGSLTFYLFAIVFWFASLIQSVIDFRATLGTNQFYLVARTVVALAGTATIVVLFKLARAMSDEITAMIAAFFLAIVTLHVRESHFAMTDTLLTLLVTTSLLLLVRAFKAAVASDKPGWGLRRFAAAGLVAGLATSTKYSAASLVGAMGVTQLLLAWRAGSRWWAWRVWTPAAAFVAAWLLGFVVGTPYSVLDYRAFAGGLSFDLRHLAGGHGVDVGAAWIYHLQTTLPAGLSVPVCVAALAGVVPLLKRGGQPALIVLAFCAALYGSMATGHTVFFRYVLPLVPPICLSAAALVSWAAEWLAPRLSLKPAMIAGVIAAVVGIPTLVNSVWLDMLLARTDTRLVAGDWLAAHVKKDDSFYDAGNGYAQVFLGGVRAHVWKFETWDTRSKSFGEPSDRLPEWLVLPQSPLEVYTFVPGELREAAKTQYDLAYLVRASVEPDPGVYDKQDAFFLPIARLGSVLRPGPTIAIYRRRLEPAR
jgi:4-amino-4-deoxy-L-arabinose transferase-like glycosyltransferase